jgi:hypothetical protein
MKITEKKQYCYDMLNSKVELDTNWLIEEVFSNHENWDLKCGDGVSHISIAKSPNHPTKCFYIHRVDGTFTDIGIGAALSPPKPYQKIAMACRTAILPSIDLFRETVNYGKQRCTITNTVLTRDNSHIDHHTPQFNEIVKDWIANASFTYDDLVFIVDKAIDKNVDNSSITSFTNQELANDFRKYHDSVAVLRCITGKENLRREKTTALADHFTILKNSKR